MRRPGHRPYRAEDHFRHVSRHQHPARSHLRRGIRPDLHRRNLSLDGYSDDLGIGVEFVSTDDILDWKADTGMAATVEEFDLKGTAQRLADCTDNVAVFYDPTADDDLDFTGSNEESYVESNREQSLEELRAQVRDFLQWLKAQGVI